ncbi:MAG TPA: zf-HC2 domain-containing protein [Chloroflexia bacterium]|jgi:hypothetical protein
MNCGEIRPLISAFLDGEATPEEQRSVERHLATCEECRHVLAEYRAIGSDLRALPVPVPPAGLRRDVWRAIEARQGGPRVVKPSPSSQGKIIPLPQNRNKPGVINILTGAGNGWARAIPAAVLVAALLIAVSYFMIFNKTPVALANMLEQGDIVDYSQPVHVLLAKSVKADDIQDNTTVHEVSGDSLVPVETENKYRSRGPNSGELVIYPVGAWKAGVQYRIVIDARRVQLWGVVGDNPLGDKPIELSFNTAMYTPTPSSTPTDTPIPTETPVPPTDTPEPPAEDTPAPTAMAQESPQVPVAAVSNTPEPSAATATMKPNTPVPPTATRPAPTNTRVAPTATTPPPPTNTVAPSNTPVQEPTATSQPTQAPSATPNVSATPTRRSAGSPTVTATVTVTVQPRITPGKATPTVSPISDCLLEPVRGFGAIWRGDSDVRERLGCPTVPEEPALPAAQQHFQGGYMFWRGDTRVIYVFLQTGRHDQYGTWFEFKDTWVEGEPVPTVEGGTPDGGYVPVRGFGKLWANNPELRQKLGYATEPEASVDAVWQPFEHGRALWTSDRTIRLMYEDGIWQHFNDTYVGE